MPRGVYPHRPQTAEERAARSRIARERGYGLWMRGRKPVQNRPAASPRVRPSHVCKRCGAIFRRSPSRLRAGYCTRSCGMRARRGERSPRWCGGRRSQRGQAMACIEYRQWRVAVFARDGYRCCRCGGTGRLHAHHVLRWATHPDRRYDVSNGETLCHGCHRLEHSAKRAA